MSADLQKRFRELAKDERVYVGGRFATQRRHDPVRNNSNLVGSGARATLNKVMFNLPIPRFDPKQRLHTALAAAAERAEGVAAAVELPEGVRFQRARGLVRTALAEAGLSQEIDRLVARLLDGN